MSVNLYRVARNVFFDYHVSSLLLPAVKPALVVSRTKPAAKRVFFRPEFAATLHFYGRRAKQERRKAQLSPPIGPCRTCCKTDEPRAFGAFKNPYGMIRAKKSLSGGVHFVAANQGLKGVSRKGGGFTDSCRVAPAGALAGCLRLGKTGNGSND